MHGVVKYSTIMPITKTTTTPGLQMMTCSIFAQLSICQTNLSCNVLLPRLFVNLVKAQIPQCRLPRDVPVDLSAKSPTSPFLRRKRACCRLITGIFQTISTCRDGLKPRNCPVTSLYVGDFPVTVTRVTEKFRGSRRNGIWA